MAKKQFEYGFADERKEKKKKERKSERERERERENVEKMKFSQGHEATDFRFRVYRDG